MRVTTVLSLIPIMVFGATGVRADDNANVEKDRKKFQGAWTFMSVEAGGKKEPLDQFKGMTVTFDGNKFAVKQGDEVVFAGIQKLDPSKSPKAVDVTVTEGPNKGAVMLGIYEINADTFKVCFDPEGKKRPTEFKTMAGSPTFVNVHKRVKK